MRTSCPVWVTTAAVGLLLLAACGDDADNTDGGSQPVDGGEDASLPDDYFACDVPSDCTVIPQTCCGTCGAPVRGDAIAVAKRKAVAYSGMVCEPNSGCGTCAPLFIDPTLVATCRDSRCELVDLDEHPASECENASDCRIRTPDCCPCDGDTSLGRLIAVSSDNAYEALVCDPEQACPECAPVYPHEVAASCTGEGHCQAHDPRVPGTGAACEVDGVVYPSGAGGIDDPTSCNECLCDDGQLRCTDLNCPEPCPSGSALGSDCASCGPVDECLVVRSGCLPTCESSDDCTSGTCDEERGVCVTLCG